MMGARWAVGRGLKVEGGGCVSVWIGWFVALMVVTLVGCLISSFHLQELHVVSFWETGTVVSVSRATDGCCGVGDSSQWNRYSSPSWLLDLPLPACDTQSRPHIPSFSAVCFFRE